MTRVEVAQREVEGIEDGVQTGHHLLWEALHHEPVEIPHQLERRYAHQGVGTHDPTQLAHHQGGTAAAPHHVADDQRGAAIGQPDDVVPVTAYLGSLPAVAEVRRHLDAFEVERLVQGLQSCRRRHRTGCAPQACFSTVPGECRAAGPDRGASSRCRLDPSVKAVSSRHDGDPDDRRRRRRGGGADAGAHPPARCPRRFDVVGEGASGLEAIELVERHAAGAAPARRLDARHGRAGGVAAGPRASRPSTRVVMYSGFAEVGLADRMPGVGGDRLLREVDLARHPGRRISWPCSAPNATTRRRWSGDRRARRSLRGRGRDRARRAPGALPGGVRGGGHRHGHASR